MIIPKGQIVYKVQCSTNLFGNIFLRFDINIEALVVTAQNQPEKNQHVEKRRGRGGGGEGRGGGVRQQNQRAKTQHPMPTGTSSHVQDALRKKKKMQFARETARFIAPLDRHATLPTTPKPNVISRPRAQKERP